jgi:hypothetical protein
MKIPPTIEPIAHISPYRPIDPSHPGRKRVIRLDEWQASGSTRKPDPAIYRYDARKPALGVEGGRAMMPYVQCPSEVAH